MILSYDAKRLKTFMEKSSSEIIRMTDSYKSVMIAMTDFYSAYMELNHLMQEYGLLPMTDSEFHGKFKDI